MTVSLRDLHVDDAAWLDTWLGACASSVGYDAIDARAASASLFARLERADLHAKVIRTGDDIGIVTYRIAEPAMIEFVGVQPTQARRGYGHAGAALVEEILRASGAGAIYAPASAIHGIAVYFWIRLGYRPLLQDEFPCKRDGVAWLKRDLDPAP